MYKNDSDAMAGQAGHCSSAAKSHKSHCTVGLNEELLEPGTPENSTTKAQRGCFNCAQQTRRSHLPLSNQFPTTLDFLNIENEWLSAVAVGQAMPRVLVEGRLSPYRFPAECKPQLVMYSLLVASLML